MAIPPIYKLDKLLLHSGFLVGAVTQFHPMALGYNIKTKQVCQAKFSGFVDIFSSFYKALRPIAAFALKNPKTAL